MENNGKPKTLKALMKEALPALIAIFDVLLHLKWGAIPPTRLEVIRSAAGAFEIEVGAARSVPSADIETLFRTPDDAALFLGHDSGVIHLSAMRCVPTVTLFKGSDTAQWAPLGPFVRVIENWPGAS